VLRGNTVIDVHGHMSSPPQFRAFAFNLTALRTPDTLRISDEQMQPALDRHIRLLDSHGIDVQLISPRPVAMMHWERPFLVESWTRTTNDIIAQQCRMLPERFVGIAQLPQSGDRSTANCVEELERCVGELGFVGAILNPDPSGDRQTPGVNDEYWFPLYERAQALRATLVVHPSISRDPRIEVLAHSYQYNNLTEETLATLLFEQTPVLETFPDLHLVICHCGGALRRLPELGQPLDAVEQARGVQTRVVPSGESAGGGVGIISGGAERAHRAVSPNLYFDTCAYDPTFLAAAVRQRGVARMVFGTEVPGSGSAMMNPLLGRPVDDVLAMLESFEFLAAEDVERIVHANALQAFPLLSERLKR
jgi:predicted TIM-barrel fold metal-dependent hydrolase